MAAALSLGVAACAPQAEQPLGASIEPSAYRLPTPNVRMAADPPPPFTYWAPEGATIRNHPTNPGIWIAYVRGQNVAHYYGDACKASDYQRFVGQPLSALPPQPEGATWRSYCQSCIITMDLRRDRMNIVFDGPERTITGISCS